MRYNKETYERVRNKIYNRKLKFEKELEQRTVVFYTRFPRAKEIKAELASLSLNVARIVLKGGDVRDELTKLKKRSSLLREELQEIISSSGFPSDYLEMKYECNRCNDEGYIDGKMCDCMKNMLKQELYDEVNKVSRLSKCTFENFSLKYYPNYSVEGSGINARERVGEILDYCKKYSREFTPNSKGLLFTGATGLGKTHLALAIANEVINKGYTVVYTSAHNMISQVERSKFEHEMLDEELRFTECDLLILDDLGAEHVTNFSKTVLYNVLDTRMIKSLPIIITTNLEIGSIEKVYSGRIFSRILGDNIRLNFLGQDIRQKLRIMKSSNKKTPN